MLGYIPRPDSPDEDLVDRHDRNAPFWFEEMEELRADGSGTIHLVIWVPGTGQLQSRGRSGRPPGAAQRRGGPWDRADPAGNEVDIKTTSAPESGWHHPSSLGRTEPMDIIDRHFAAERARRAGDPRHVHR